MTVHNATRDTVLAEQARVARYPWTRARGMIGRRFTGFDGMVFPRCGSIHTWFMGQPIDVVFLDGENRVLTARRQLRPWRLAVVKGARQVVELPAGRIEATETGVGDQLTLSVE